MKRWSAWGVIGVLLLLLLACGGGSSTPTPTPNNVIGDKVVIGTTQWSATEIEVKDSFEGRYATAIPNGVFLVVYAQATNNGSSAQSIPVPTIQDESGREYEVSRNANLSVIIGSDACTMLRLNPDMAKTCWFVYDIPRAKADATTVWTLQVQALEPFGGKAEIRLVTQR